MIMLAKLMGKLYHITTSIMALLYWAVSGCLVSTFPGQQSCCMPSINSTNATAGTKPNPTAFPALKLYPPSTINPNKLLEHSSFNPCESLPGTHRCSCSFTYAAFTSSLFLFSSLTYMMGWINKRKWNQI